jgi:8-oxo-dGTP pyrophosphatase MutT (NUDIX family)
MSETKTSYLSPASATLEVSAVRSLEPSASITLDLGIPFTVFSIKFPIPEERRSFPEVAGEALGVMLDEMAAFMLSLGYRQGVIAKVYALAMECYRGMQGQEAPEEREATIGTVRGEFPLPTEFVNETQKQVVTAARGESPVHIRRTSTVALCGRRAPFDWTFPDDTAYEYAGGQRRVFAEVTCPECKRVYGEQAKRQAATAPSEESADIFWHITSQRSAVGIDKRGIRKGRRGYVWLATSPEAAQEFAETIGPRYAIVQVRWPYEKTVPDEDFEGEAMGEVYRMTPFDIPPKSILGIRFYDEGGLDMEASSKTSGKEVRRMPVQRRMEFTSQRPSRPSKSDVLKAIRKYRFQSIKNTPRPLYLVVYDQMGNPKGTLSLGPGFHNDLLKMQYGKTAVRAGKSFDLATEAVRAGGGIFKGIGEDGRGGELVYFDNPANKSTLVLDAEGITPEAVRRKIEWNSSLSRRAAATCEFCKAPSVGCVVNYAQPGGPFLGSAVHVCEGHREQGKDPRASQTAFVSNRWERRPGESRVPYPEFSERKEAGQWGERSYDGDMVHDILDKHRPSHREKDPSEWLGFDEPVPPAEVPAVLGEIKGMDRGELDAKQQYVGVVVFLVEHGSEVPQEARLRAAEVAEELAGLTVGMGNAPSKDRQQWRHPEKRKARLRREVAVLRAGMPVAKEGRFLRVEEMRAWGRGEQDEYYAQHPELERIGKPKQADYWDEQGYWAGAGHAASGVLPVCTSTGRVCLAWRSPDVDQGSCWGTIGGAVKEGMDPSSSARHELAEETGYRGNLLLHPAHVFKSGKFSYHNYIGEVGHEFGLRPEGGSAWETEALEWGGLDEWLKEAKTSPGSFHPGVLVLLRESGGLIRSICEKAEGRKTENGEAQAQAL